MSKPSAATSRGSSPLTVPFVASGTNAGVRTSPCAVRRTPARASEPGSRCRIFRALTTAYRRSTVRRRQIRWLRLAMRPAAYVHSLLGGLDRPRLGAGDADLDAARLGLRGLGDADLEHAAVEARGDGLGIDALGQRERARERAHRALEPVVAVLLGLVLGLALTRDREDVALDLDVDVGLGEAR